MRSNTITRTRLVVLAAVGAFAALVPAASADSTLPVWTCRASAAYVELSPLLGPQRIEPVLANGFPDRVTPDREQCAGAATGVQDTAVPVGTPLVTLNAASATTTITPAIAAARDQTVTADGAIAGAVHVALAGLDVQATAVTASADASCTQGASPAPSLTGSSQIATLSINGTAVIPPAANTPQEIFLPGLIRVRFNDQVVDGTATSSDQALTQRAVTIDVLPSLVAGVQPLTRVVLAEAKVDRHGAVCAAAVVPTCPAGYVAQAGGPPLVCLKTDTVTVTNNVPTPCGAGTAANAAGVCVATPTTCPTGTARDPNSNTCVLVVQRPCPTGSTADPATMVCVVRVAGNSGSDTGENGRVGSPTGPVATCGRLEMHFVHGGMRSVGRSFTSVFGNRTVTRGQLVSCGSNPRPIFGARVDVVHVLPNGARRRKTGLRSREAGKLTLILPLNLRTRRIEYAYRPDLRSTKVTSRVVLSLTVKSKRGRVLR